MRGYSYKRLYPSVFFLTIAFYFMRMYSRYLFTIISLLWLGVTGCQKPASQEKATASLAPRNGIWRASLAIPAEEVPFMIDWQGNHCYIINGKERILVKDIKQVKDSLFIRMPVFDSEFKCALEGDSLLTGTWHNYMKAKDYTLPFKAVFGQKERFVRKEGQAAGNIAGSWAVTFSPDSASKSAAVGIFENEGDKMLGTFLTESGDYRYLEGVQENGRLRLSCFDGSHAFLFDAKLSQTGELAGVFYSGKHHQEKWVGRRDANARLRDPNSLTFLKPNTEFAFSFPDLQGQPVAFPSDRFKNKVTVVQIFGSWCPNCMDETKLLSEWHRKYQPQGFEVVGLGFERGENFATSVKNVERVKTHFQIQYPLLIAGATREVKAADALPMLNHVMAFPTTIYIDRKGKVRKIYTGFSGPGTGVHYEQFKKETETFIEKLLSEN